MSINTISYEVDNETNKVLYSKEIDKILIKDISDLKSDQKILFIYDKNRRIAVQAFWYRYYWVA